MSKKSGDFLKYKILKPTTQRNFNSNIYGYDIETTGQKNKFYCASIYSDKYKKFFFKPEDVLKELSHYRYRNSIISATNLMFDFFGTIKGKDLAKFSIMFNGSRMLWAKTYYDTKTKQFYHKSSKSRYPIKFIDTLNYAHLSVERLGNLIKSKKLNKPKCLGKIPKNKRERDELLTYNMKDSEISYKALKFLYRSFYKLGATPQNTIASSSLSLFRNKYLKDSYLIHTENNLEQQFNAYYGGRTETFARGTFHNYNFYDINSLYSFTMLNSFPNPNTMKFSKENTTRYIEAYEGVSDVIISCPYMDYPLLPFKHEHKLLFPTGLFRGWYSHIEINRATELGYIIIKVKKTIYFTENCYPFKDYVIDLYNKRKTYPKTNPMNFVTKIMLNSLYGKFGQKYKDRDKWVHGDNITPEMIHKCRNPERIGDYFRLKADTKPSVCCMPIWALYVTAYARIELHRYLEKYQAIYCDTDSIITKKELESSLNIGRFKLEDRIKTGIIIKPKMYGYVNFDKNDHVKIKGLHQALTFNNFKKFITEPKHSYRKFLKFKEAIRRKLTVNEIIEFEKIFDLEDNKRVWQNKFDVNDLVYSRPIEVYKNEIKTTDFERKEREINKKTLYR